MISGRCYTTGADVIAKCILLNTMADVIAIIVVDVITTCLYYIVYGWCYSHICVADVIATEADVIAYHICISWLMLLPRKWQMLLPLRLMLLPTIFIFLG